MCYVVKFYEGGLSMESAYKLTYHSINKLIVTADKLTPKT